MRLSNTPTSMMELSIATQLSAAGVEGAVSVEDIDAEPTGWIALVEPHEYLFECFHSTGWRNFQGYKNDEVDKLLEQAKGEFDQTSRGDLYKVAEDMIVEDCPCVFVMHSNAHNLWRDNITGFPARPDQAYGSGFASVEKS